MEHLCSTPPSVHEKVGCGLGPSHRTLSTSSRPSSAHLSAFSLRVYYDLRLGNVEGGDPCPPHPIRFYCHESFGKRENHKGLVVGQGIVPSSFGSAEEFWNAAVFNC